jgi:inward rectifier potassium channel
MSEAVRPAPAASTEDSRDFGLGDRVAQQSRARLLNRDGSFNVRRAGLSLFRSLSLYHHLLNTSWTRFFASVAAFYLVSNVVFAAAFVLCGKHALQGTRGETLIERFLESFFFSVHTLATIGYGSVSPASLAANILVTVEALIGLMGLALVTGILFARFSRPSAQILFSRQAVVGPYRDITALMLRIANERTTQLIEVEATVSLNLWQGERRKFYELPLERKKVLFFPLHWVIVHPIDERSPLWGMGEADFRGADAEVLVLLTAVEEDFGQTVHARTSYKPAEVVWGARFADLYLRSDDGMLGIDVGRLHEIERA